MICWVLTGKAPASLYYKHPRTYCDWPSLIMWVLFLASVAAAGVVERGLPRWQAHARQEEHATWHDSIFFVKCQQLLGVCIILNYAMTSYSPIRFCVYHTVSPFALAALAWLTLSYTVIFLELRNTCFLHMSFLFFPFGRWRLGNHLVRWLSCRKEKLRAMPQIRREYEDQSSFLVGEDKNLCSSCTVLHPCLHLFLENLGSSNPASPGIAPMAVPCPLDPWTTSQILGVNV